MFDLTSDQASGLRRLFRSSCIRMIPVGILVSDNAAQSLVGTLFRSAVGQSDDLKIINDLPQIGRDQVGVVHATAGAGIDHMVGAIRSEGGKLSDAETVVLLWISDPLEVTKWVKDQGGTRVLLVLSQKRSLMTEQYARIKSFYFATGIRRFGVVFSDIDDERCARESFLTLASCARRFLNIQLDVVVGSFRDEDALRMWSGLSVTAISQYTWSSLSGVWQIDGSEPFQEYEVKH
ncbi:MAG: hypothetical protein Q4B13_05930 [Lautropia sp.]|nr:hypothetical protein [Lautropia sp.]